MNGRQIAEDEVDELVLSGAVRVDERPKSVGIFSQTVARDEYFGLDLWFRVSRIRRIHTEFPR